MKEQETVEVVDETTKLPYEHCLNCGTELKGLYCHSCGQEAVNKTPTLIAKARLLKKKIRDLLKLSVCRSEQ